MKRADLRPDVRYVMTSRYTTYHPEKLIQETCVVLSTEPVGKIKPRGPHSSLRRPAPFVAGWPGSPPVAVPYTHQPSRTGRGVLVRTWRGDVEAVNLEHVHCTLEEHQAQWYANKADRQRAVREEVARQEAAWEAAREADQYVQRVLPDVRERFGYRPPRRDSGMSEGEVCMTVVAFADALKAVYASGWDEATWAANPSASVKL